MKRFYLFMRQLCRMANIFFTGNTATSNGNDKEQPGTLPVTDAAVSAFPYDKYQTISAGNNTQTILDTNIATDEDAAYDELQHLVFSHLSLTAPINIVL